MKIRIEHEDHVAIVVIDNPPINAGSAPVRAELMTAIEHLDGDPATATVVVMIGANGRFIAGSDIREFGGPLEPPELPAVIAAIEASAKPFVAALSGAALGGGYELALGCDWRIAAPGTVVGLPETTLGIIPGAGGTQRLPRLIGMIPAMNLICRGTRVEAVEALALGMVDALAQRDLREEAIMAARSLMMAKRRLSEKAVPPFDEAARAAKETTLGKDGKARPASQGTSRQSDIDYLLKAIVS